jgi:hypothetical protein
MVLIELSPSHPKLGASLLVWTCPHHPAGLCALQHCCWPGHTKYTWRQPKHEFYKINHAHSVLNEAGWSREAGLKADTGRPWPTFLLSWVFSNMSTVCSLASPGRVEQYSSVRSSYSAPCLCVSLISKRKFLVQMENLGTLAP